MNATFLRRTFRWMVILVVFGAIAAAIGFAWFRSRFDNMLLAEARSGLSEIFPEVVIDLDAAHFDWQSSITLRSLTLSQSSSDAMPIVQIPELLISIDRDELIEHRRVDVRRIKVISPQINLTRSIAGQWTISDLFPPKLQHADRASPEWLIEDAVITVNLEQPGDSEPLSLRISGANLQLIPDGKKQYVLQGLTNIEGGSQCRVTGRFDFERRTWNLSGNIDGVDTSGELAGFLLASSGNIQERVDGITKQINPDGVQYVEGETYEPKASSHQMPFRTVSRSEDANAFISDAESYGSSTLTDDSAPTVEDLMQRPVGDQSEQRFEQSSPDSVGVRKTPDFGVAVKLGVNFEVGQTTSGGPVGYRVLADLKDGLINNPMLPISLERLTGQIVADNGGITVKNLTGRDGDAIVDVNGEYRYGDSHGHLVVSGTDVRFGPDQVRRTPRKLRNLLEKIRPDGLADFRVDLIKTSQGLWKAQNFVGTAKGMTALPEPFPHPVTDIRGTMTQRGKDRLDLDFEGKGGSTRLKLKGVVLNVGKPVEAAIQIDANSAALTQQVYDACNPEVRKTLTSLGLAGRGDVRLRYYRPPINKAPLQWVLDIAMQSASANFEHFPYRVEEIKGHVRFDSVTDNWAFANVSGRHGPTVIRGKGSMVKSDGTDLLNLEVWADHMALDRDLRAAIPQFLKERWDVLRPSGWVDVAGKVSWQPGTDPIVELDSVRLTDGRILHREFPYEIEQIQASLSYADDKISVSEFVGWHDDARLTGHGSVVAERDDTWRLRFNQLSIDGFVAGARFRRAIAPTLKDLIDSLNPRGVIDLTFDFLELRGTEQADGPVTAAWDFVSDFEGTDFTAGIDLLNASGRVRCRGTYDGSDADVVGAVELRKVTSLEHVIKNCRGPFRYADGVFIAGSPKLFSARRPASVPTSERIAGEFIGGVVTVDAKLEAINNYPYQVRTEVSGGRLEKYAAEYLSGAQNLEGVMNGWTNVRGEALLERGMVGRGQVKISPAALYELPVFAQLFNVLNFAKPDRTAFNYAFFDFRMDDEKFIFDKIDMVGDAVSFRGRGTATYEEQLKLDFFSTLPRSRVTIPIIDTLMRSATNGWVGIQVRGQVETPTARVVAAPALDTAMRRLRNALDGRPSSNSGSRRR
ncbi:hypothetical protein [Stratiformator vulcanicus]|uniref:AsmA-like C-terminal domain-containing protein n=1 Tax=Stratiformator vulcanicus TaxID=2527980 RepID=A0A517R2G7_9PLAN|nr:hypothetical protein [Stratiformator vulcanicus]QDT38072.1 hypothetical protein Pan189_24570 [Stratiformator vulcanicus]